MSSLTTAGSSMEDEEFFDTRLSLEIGETSRPQRQTTTTTTVRLFGELISPQDRAELRLPTPAGRNKKRAESGAAIATRGGGRHNKKAKTTSQADQNDDGDHRRSPSDDGDLRIPSVDGGSSRKKLRLTSAQATMLEDTFRAHSILSHAQKHELARRIGLSARQVEVWFQNRRARTKLKQTEVDCELLRRWCDRLTDENARLRRDLAEIRAAAGTNKLPAAVSAVCPSCCDKKAMAIVVAGDVA